MAVGGAALHQRHHIIGCRSGNRGCRGRGVRYGQGQVRRYNSCAMLAHYPTAVAKAAAAAAAAAAVAAETHSTLTIDRHMLGQALYIYPPVRVSLPDGQPPGGPGPRGGQQVGQLLIVHLAVAGMGWGQVGNAGSQESTKAFKH